MRKARALVVSLAVGLAVAAGVFAVARTGSIRAEQRAKTDRQVAQRTAQLNRYEASLKATLARKQPPLPKLPKASKSVAFPTQESPVPTIAASPVARTSAPARVLYASPPTSTRAPSRAAPAPAIGAGRLAERYQEELSDD